MTKLTDTRTEAQKAEARAALEANLVNVGRKFCSEILRVDTDRRLSQILSRGACRRPAVWSLPESLQGSWAPSLKAVS